MLSYLHGKLLAFNDEYDPIAESKITHAISMLPDMPDIWLTLAEIQWKKKDFVGAKTSIEKSISLLKQNPAAMHKLSMVLRKIGKNPDEVYLNTKKSIDVAKEAVSLDVKNGLSWYILGNAHLSFFFLTGQHYNVQDLNMALSAFKQAEKSVEGLNKVDMYFNRATVYRYLEDYQLAINDLDSATSLDPDWPTPKQSKLQITDMLQSIHKAITSKGNLPQSKIKSFVASINEDRNKNGFSQLNQLNIGNNTGKVLVCTIVGLINNPTGIPLTTIVMDQDTECVALSVYNLASGILKVGNKIEINSPKLKDITIKADGKAWDYKTIVVDVPTLIKINGKEIQKDWIIGTAFTTSDK
uniref:Tetratricopeptide repeat protein 5 OB fold domain-containing protein n=1 Tax=Arcella intermedia TaxID=1963864 RepID=A0A6B2L706_9EUKA